MPPLVRSEQIDVNWNCPIGIRKSGREILTEEEASGDPAFADRAADAREMTPEFSRHNRGGVRLVCTGFAGTGKRNPPADGIDQADSGPARSGLFG